MFLTDEERHIINVLFQIPFEYVNGKVSGLKYEALKDFCKWYGLKPLSKYVPIFLNLGRHYANIVNSK